MTFGERLKQLREAAGFTQAATWEAAGLRRKTYLNYEQGLVTERIPFSAVVALAKALGTDCTAFAGCTDVIAVEAESDEPEPAGRGRPAVAGVPDIDEAKPTARPKPARGKGK